MPDVCTLRQKAFETLAGGRTKHTQANVETGSGQSLQICALQGSPGNLYSFHTETPEERHRVAVD